MMRHTIGRLLHASAPSDFPLKSGLVNLVLLMDRAIQYYKRAAEPNDIRIVHLAVGQIPLVWADAVAVAVVADNLLSNAVKVSPPGSTIYVQLMSEESAVVCSVRDAGPGLTKEARDQLFQRMRSTSQRRGLFTSTNNDRRRKRTKNTKTTKKINKSWCAS